MVAIGISCFGLGDRQRALVDLRYPVVIQIDQIGFKLDVNRADWPEWTQLPRIGETLARRIVESRDEGGLFQAHEDLTHVSGIGPRTLANMRPYLLAIEPQDAVGRP
jgi:competence protein ComEA